MHNAITADAVLRGLALSVARNNVGAMRPIHEIYGSEGLTQTEYDAISTNPTFKQYVLAYENELKEAGFSFAAKARVLAEDLLPTAYHMARDPDTPSAVRRQIIADFVDWGKLNPKNDVSVAPGTGFSVTINFPGTPQRPSETVVIEAEGLREQDQTSEKPPEKGLETPKIAQKTPILLVEDEDYEYAGEDYL